MKRMITISFLGLLCVTAWADELKPGFRPWTTVVKEADTNKDGMLEPMEIMNFTDISAPGFRPFLAQNFMDFDSDKDGMLAKRPKSLRHFFATISRFLRSNIGTHSTGSLAT